LLDSLVKGYPFGALLIWETRYLEVAYRDFIVDYAPGQLWSQRQRIKANPWRWSSTVRQRLQSFLIAVYGSHEGRRLYFDVASGPNSVECDGTTVSLELIASHSGGIKNPIAHIAMLPFRKSSVGRHDEKTKK